VGWMMVLPLEVRQFNKVVWDTYSGCAAAAATCCWFKKRAF